MEMDMDVDHVDHVDHVEKRFPLSASAVVKFVIQE